MALTVFIAGPFVFGTNQSHYRAFGSAVIDGPASGSFNSPPDWLGGDRTSGPSARTTSRPTLPLRAITNRSLCSGLRGEARWGVAQETAKIVPRW
jgi:hypothetical protein